MTSMSRPDRRLQPRRYVASASSMPLKIAFAAKSADIRCAVRQAETKPLMEYFKLWLDRRLGEVSQKSGLAEAIRYALSHWEGLTRFLSDGRIEIDNNIVERTMRPIGLGRRNYLFAGSDEGGRTWSIIASLINSAKTQWNRSAGISDRCARAHRLRTHQDQPAPRTPAVVLEGSASSRGR